MLFYDKVNALCLKKGISITFLAMELGFSKGTPTNWKTMTAPPRIGNVKKIADYFNVPIEYFYSDENKKELPTSNEEFINMLRNHNQGKAQVFFCGADGKVFELSPEEESIMQNLIKLRKDNK